MLQSLGAATIGGLVGSASGDYGPVLTVQMKTAPLLCLDLKGGATADGTPIDIWECNGSENQLWYFPSGTWQIKYAGDPTKCIDGSDIKGGSQLKLWNCNGMTQQKWGYDSSKGSIYLADSETDANLCMDLAGGKTSGGTAVQSWACNGLWEQQWTLSFGITIRASWNYHLCLDLAGGDATNGKALWMWDCNGSPNQKWYFNAGDYHIRFAGNPNKCLDAGDMQAGQKLQIWDCVGNKQQTWGYDPKMGTVFLSASQQDASLCVDLAGGGSKAGTGLDVWSCNGCWNQGFTVVGPATTAAKAQIAGMNASSSRGLLGSCPPKPGPGPSPGPPGPSPPSPPGPSPTPGENPMNIKPNPKRSDNFFFIIGDWGAPAGKSHGCQKKIADMMRSYVSKQAQQGKKLLFVAAAGDNFYYTGLDKNKRDSQYADQWKNIYTDLTNVPWLAVYGNHDHGSSDPGCACGKGCNQFNSAGRPAGMGNFWIPNYYWHYLIPEVQLEVIGIDTNAVDVNGLGGGGCHGGAAETCKVCGGTGNIQKFLNQKKGEGEGYMDQRAKSTSATTVAIIQHYPNSDLAHGYKIRFEKNNGNKAKVLSAYGHTHDQICQGDRTRGCDVIMTGGGGGYVDNGKNLGFTAVHLTDDGGFQTVMETSETRFPGNACKWFYTNASTEILL